VLARARLAAMQQATDPMAFERGVEQMARSLLAVRLKASPQAR